MASGTQDEAPRRRTLKKEQALQWRHGNPHLPLIVGLSEKKAKERTNIAMAPRSPTPAAHS